MTKPSLRPIGIETRNEYGVLTLRSDGGEEFEVILNSSDLMTLQSASAICLQEIAASPNPLTACVEMHHIQYSEREGKEFFRVYLNEQLSHEYAVPPNTTLSVELKAFADRVEARNLARATTPPPGPGKAH